MYVGDVEGRACMEVLPSLDVAESELTSEMRMARLLSAESLQLHAPEPPAGRSAAEITSWSEDKLKPWLEQKQKRAQAAQEELDRAAVQNHRQRIVAGALMGLVFEDIARDLLIVPVPQELASEPEIADIFHELMLKQAEPYLQHARLAYNACAGNAQGLRSMSHWEPFCLGRSDSLPNNSEAEPEQDGVTVIRTAER